MQVSEHDQLSVILVDMIGLVVNQWTLLVKCSVSGHDWLTGKVSGHDWLTGKVSEHVWLSSKLVDLSGHNWLSAKLVVNVSGKW